MHLLSTGNPKIEKGQKQGYLSFILHLAPAKLSGHETCPKRTQGCTNACLNKAGRGGMPGKLGLMIQSARIRKTKLFFNDRAAFMAMLVHDIESGIRKAERMGFIPVFRLNGTSDISWEKYSVMRQGIRYPNIFAAFPTVQFYDYTKVLGRKAVAIPNYHLTFSAADGNDSDVAEAIRQGYNVATVFGIKKGMPFPDTWQGLPVFNGDDSDLRFLDPKGHIVALYAKGPAKNDNTGFVKYPVFNVALAA